MRLPKKGVLVKHFATGGPSGNQFPGRPPAQRRNVRLLIFRLSLSSFQRKIELNDGHDTYAERRRLPPRLVPTMPEAAEASQSLGAHVSVPPPRPARPRWSRLSAPTAWPYPILRKSLQRSFCTFVVHPKVEDCSARV